MKSYTMKILLFILVLALISCVGRQSNIFEATESQAKLRSIQSRVFDITDRNRLLRTIIATMQDLGFVIDSADEALGTVSGTKRENFYSLIMTVSVRPKGKHQMIVRSNARYNLQTVEDPEPYQQFFAALSRALFLSAQENSSAGKLPGTGGYKAGTKSGNLADQSVTMTPPYDPGDQWTGRWKVESTSQEGIGIWGLKQRGNAVVSTKDSLYKIRGNIRRGRLEGTLFPRKASGFAFVLNISADGQSFEGKLNGWANKTVHLKGTKLDSDTSAYSLNIYEPWTGVWKVEGHQYFTGKWILNQDAGSVKSTSNSSHKIDSSVVGHHLKGKIIIASQSFSFTIKISSDGRSFTGTSTDYYGKSVYIKGERIE